VLGVTDEDGSLGQLLSKGTGAEATARIDTMPAGWGVPGGPIRTSGTPWPMTLHIRTWPPMSRPTTPHLPLPSVCPSASVKKLSAACT